MCVGALGSSAMRNAVARLEVQGKAIRRGGAVVVVKIARGVFVALPKLQPSEGVPQEGGGIGRCRNSHSATHDPVGI